MTSKISVPNCVYKAGNEHLVCNTVFIFKPVPTNNCWKRYRWG